MSQNLRCLAYLVGRM